MGIELRFKLQYKHLICFNYCDMSKGITDFHRLLLHAKVYQLFFFGNLPRLKFRAGEAAAKNG